MRAIAKIRVKYAKREPLRFLSHLEVVSAIRFAVRRAELPVCYSEGFSPQLKISFGPPLGLGYTSVCEVFDMELSRRVLLDKIRDALSLQMPKGLDFVSCEAVPVLTKSPDVYINMIQYTVDAPKLAGLAEQKIKDFFTSESFLVERVTDKSRRVMDARPLVREMSCVGTVITMLMKCGPQKTIKPDVLLQKMFNLSETDKLELRVNREKCFHELENGKIMEI